MTITLEAVKAEHVRIGEKIAALEAQAVTVCKIPGANIVLNAGEHYAGIVLDEVGNPAYHLILLPGEKEKIKWAAAKDWAAEQDGQLPTRCEQSLLFANLKSHLKPNYYWSCEVHKDDSGYAWYQHFTSGYQTSGNVSAELRARAVRRLIID